MNLLSKATLALGFLSFCSLGFAAEDLRGEADSLFPPTLTLYGRAHDLLNPSNHTIRVRVCWDSPSANCDTPVQANGPAGAYVNCTANCDGFQYTVPSGLVGSVNPRDGAAHLMYASIVSQQNPGAGDKPMDGTPFPFTYRSGTAAPLWQANLGTPGRLNASQLAVFANRLDTYSIGSSGSIVCNVSGTAIKDDGVVGYYVVKHGVPCANVRVVSAVVTQLMPVASFNSNILPTLQALPASIQAIAIGWIQPSVVTGTVTDQSISSLMAVQGMVTGTGCYGGAAGLGQGPVNPYFNSSSNTPYTSYGLRPSMMLAGEICPTCTPTDNVSHQWIADFPTIKRVIDAALAAVDTNPAGGHVDMAWTVDLGRSVDAVNASPLLLGNALSPLVFTQVIGSKSSPTPKTVSDTNILLFAMGAASWNYAGASFLPGAGIGYGLTSTSGRLPLDHQQTNAASWLNQGAVASNGNAVEPCELLAYKSPDEGVLIPHYTQGQTVVEALWKSVRLPWGANFIGDPLASPFSLPSAPPVLSSIAPSSGTAGGTVSVTLNGSGFTGGSTVAVTGAGVTVSNVVTVSATRITANLTVAANATPGARGVTVSTPNGTSSASSFTVTAAPAPVLSSVSPNSGTQGASVGVILTGSNFLSGATVSVSGSGVTVSNVGVSSATQITATLTIASGAAAGTRALSVTTSSGASGSLPFTVNSAATPPSVSAISPATASAGSAVSVTISGANFVGGATLNISGTGVVASNVMVVSGSRINATLTVAANAAAGSYNVSVTTSGGTSGVAPFTVTQSAGKPALTSLTPSSAHPGSTVNVTLSGSNFQPSATVRVEGGQVAVSNVVVVDASTITAVFQIPVGATLRSRNTFVTTTAGMSNGVVFTVN